VSLIKNEYSTNVATVDPSGYNAGARKGYPNRPWNDPLLAIQDSSVDYPFESGDLLYIKSGTYSVTPAPTGGGDDDSTFTKYQDTYIKMEPGTIIDISGIIVGINYFGFSDNIVVGIGDKSIKKCIIDGPNASITVSAIIVATGDEWLISFLHEDSYFDGVIEHIDLGTNISNLGIQAGCKHFSLALDELDIRCMNPIQLAATTQSDGGFVANLDNFYQSVVVKDFVHDQSAATQTSDASVWIGPKALDNGGEKTNGYIGFQCDKLILTQYGAVTCLLVSPLDGEGTVVNVKIGEVIDNGSFQPAYSGDEGVWQDHPSHRGSIHIKSNDSSNGFYEDVNLNYGKISTWRSLFAIGRDATSDTITNSTIHVHIDEGVSSLWPNIRIGGATTDVKLINTTIYISGNYTSEAEACVVINGLNLDENSKIIFRNCRFETKGAGKNCVVINAVSGVAGNVNTGLPCIIFEDTCEFINDGRALTVVGAYVGPEDRYFLDETPLDQTLGIGTIDTHKFSDDLEGNDYFNMPTIFRHTTSKIIYSFFRGGTNHSTFSDSSIYMKVSRDGGATWLSYDGLSDYDLVSTATTDASFGYDAPGAFSTPSGRILLFIRKFDNGNAYVGNETHYSDDGGQTWTVAASTWAPPSIGYVYSDELVEIPFGGIAIAYRDIQASRYIRVAQSFDDGLTWEIRSTALDNTDKGWNFGEHIIQDYGDGLWVMVSRFSDYNDDLEHYPFICVSHDYGLTWADGTETLTFQNIQDGDFQSGFLKLRGVGVSLGEESATKSCLPYFSKAYKGGRRYAIIVFHLRKIGEEGQLHITCFDIDKWLSLGQASIKPKVELSIYTESPEGPGNIYDVEGNQSVLLDSVQNPTRLIGITSYDDVTGGSSSGPQDIYYFSFDKVSNLIWLYENDDLYEGIYEDDTAASTGGVAIGSSYYNKTLHKLVTRVS
jgi:hypothetical protein